MVEISKQESQMIRELNGKIYIISTSKSKKRRGKYYIEESPKALKLLNNVRKNIFKERNSIWLSGMM